jgi:hypothetical protein
MESLAYFKITSIQEQNLSEKPKACNTFKRNFQLRVSKAFDMSILRAKFPP